jgi:hypothetical protein
MRDPRQIHRSWNRKAFSGSGLGITIFPKWVQEGVKGGFFDATGAARAYFRGTGALRLHILRLPWV